MLTFIIKDSSSTAPQSTPSETKVQIDRESVEEKILEGVINKLEQAKEHDRGMYQVLKSAIDTVLLFANVDIQFPKGVNKLEYLICHYLQLGLDVLEKEPLAVTGKVVVPEGTTAEPEETKVVDLNGSTN